jgi:hypothetical protein
VRVVGRLTQRQAKRRDHLRLVEPTTPANAPCILTDPAARKEFEQLTQRLVEASMEILDLADGDPDLEPNGDESEPNGDDEPEDWL